MLEMNSKIFDFVLFYFIGRKLGVVFVILIVLIIFGFIVKMFDFCGGFFVFVSV